MSKEIRVTRKWGDGTPSVDVLVTTALRIIDTDGLAELTTRRIAQDLGIHQPVIYRRVKDRDELLDLVVERVMSEAGRIDPAAVDWVDWLRDTGSNVHRAWQAHPSAAPLVHGYGGALPSITQFLNDVVGVLVSRGFTGADVLPPVTAYLGYVFSAAAAAPSYQGVRASTAGPRSVPRVDPAELPYVAQLQRLVSEHADPTEQFTAGLEIILAGIRAAASALTP